MDEERADARWFGRGIERRCVARGDLIAAVNFRRQLQPPQPAIAPSISATKNVPSAMSWVSTPNAYRMPLSICAGI